jgi:hypothetical protein
MSAGLRINPCISPEEPRNKFIEISHFRALNTSTEEQRAFLWASRKYLSHKSLNNFNKNRQNFLKVLAFLIEIIQ